MKELMCIPDLSVILKEKLLNIWKIWKMFQKTLQKFQYSSSWKAFFELDLLSFFLSVVKISSSILSFFHLQLMLLVTNSIFDN